MDTMQDLAVVLSGRLRSIIEQCFIYVGAVLFSSNFLFTFLTHFSSRVFVLIVFKKGKGFVCLGFELIHRSLESVLLLETKSHKVTMCYKWLPWHHGMQGT